MTHDSVGREVRNLVIEQSKRANVGHIGSSLSVVDILVALYAGILAIESPDDPERDRFMLAKGHAALALYCTLHATGRLSREQLDSFCEDGSMLGVHPECGLRGVDFSSGSLGQGLSIAAGAALAGRMQRSSRRVFALVSDAECNEGSLWEAVMFSAHHELSNLVAIIDVNGQQALGYTKDVLRLAPLGDRWRAFGWDVHTVDGHDVAALIALVAGFDTANGPPHVVLARTTFGHGVSYMEGLIEWHYRPMSDPDYERALAELQEPT